MPQQQQAFLPDESVETWHRQPRECRQRVRHIKCRPGKTDVPPTTGNGQRPEPSPPEGTLPDRPQEILFHGPMKTGDPPRNDGGFSSSCRRFWRGWPLPCIFSGRIHRNNTGQNRRPIPPHIPQLPILPRESPGQDNVRKSPDRHILPSSLFSRKKMLRRALLTRRPPLPKRLKELRYREMEHLLLKRN